jgi:hypothetical protein
MKNKEINVSESKNRRAIVTHMEFKSLISFVSIIPLILHSVVSAQRRNLDCSRKITRKY